MGGCQPEIRYLSRFWQKLVYISIWTTYPGRVWEGAAGPEIGQIRTETEGIEGILCPESRKNVQLLRASRREQFCFNLLGFDTKTLTVYLSLAFCIG